jgi:hypothetical protein
MPLAPGFEMILRAERLCRKTVWYHGTLPPRPSLPAMPPSALLPSALSTWAAVSAAPSVLPSHDAT